MQFIYTIIEPQISTKLLLWYHFALGAVAFGGGMLVAAVGARLERLKFKSGFTVEDDK